MGNPACHCGPDSPHAHSYIHSGRHTGSGSRTPTLEGQRDRRACPRASGFADLQQVVRGVVQSHDESPRPDVVGKPGEADENDGGYVMDDLLLEILQKRGSFRALIPDLSPRYSRFLPLTFGSL